VGVVGGRVTRGWPQEGLAMGVPAQGLGLLRVHIVGDCGWCWGGGLTVGLDSVLQGRTEASGLDTLLAVHMQAKIPTEGMS
jgi:hypothetical protein